MLLGESCVDEYFYGVCERLSPEAPVPVLRVTRNFSLDGMAANVLKNLQTLGQDVEFFTASAGRKTRYLDERSGQHIVRVDDDVKLAPLNGKLIFDRIANQSSKIDAIVISDYNKGYITYELVEEIRKRFTGPIFIDTKKTDLKRFEGCYVKINEVERKAASSVPDSGLITTLGGAGCVFDGVTFKGRTVEVVDICGAGDTFFSALVANFLNNNSESAIHTAIEFANVAAAISVKHQGVYAPSYDEIEELLGQGK